MAKRNRPTYDDVATLQPDEIGAVKVIVKEFISRLTNIDHEVETLKEDRKMLIEEFREKLDIKTLQHAMKVVKLESEVARKDTYDVFKELLTDDFVNDLTD